MKYRISETYPCWVTWTDVVEAESEAEALEKYYRGGKEIIYLPPSVGESVPGYASDYTVEVEN